MLITKIKALFHIVSKCSEEDLVIDQFKAGKYEIFIDYFKHENVKFKRISSREYASPTGRVIYEDDMFSYVYIDGIWIANIELPFNYSTRSSILKEAKKAVMSNIQGNIHYEERYFNAK